MDKRIGVANVDFTQLDHLHKQYEGTGNADTTREEWLKVQQKDTAAAFLLQSNLLTYTSVALELHPCSSKEIILKSYMSSLARSDDVKPRSLSCFDESDDAIDGIGCDAYNININE